jgi:deoxyadenosine/deoxycytidine kinase
MNLDQYNRIVIIGHPASGKTTLADNLVKCEPKRSRYNSDSYLSHGYEQSLYALISDVDFGNPYIIEGIQGYRLLRKMVQLDLPLPDLIIICKASEKETERRYKERGKPVPLSTQKALDTVWFEFLSICKNHPPVVHFDTSI